MLNDILKRYEYLTGARSPMLDALCSCSCINDSVVGQLVLPCSAVRVLPWAQERKAGSSARTDNYRISIIQRYTFSHNQLKPLDLSFSLLFLYESFSFILYVSLRGFNN